jgi:hypothetical protein
MLAPSWVTVQLATVADSVTGSPVSGSVPLSRTRRPGGSGGSVAVTVTCRPLTGSGSGIRPAGSGVLAQYTAARGRWKLSRPDLSSDVLPRGLTLVTGPLRVHFDAPSVSTRRAWQAYVFRPSTRSTHDPASTAGWSPSTSTGRPALS